MSSRSLNISFYPDLSTLKKTIVTHYTHNTNNISVGYGGGGLGFASRPYTSGGEKNPFRGLMFRMEFSIAAPFCMFFFSVKRIIQSIMIYIIRLFLFLHDIKLGGGGRSAVQINNTDLVTAGGGGGGTNCLTGAHCGGGGECHIIYL